MHVERVREFDGEVELLIEATPQEVSNAFDDGLEAFVAQVNLEGEGETALEKIKNTLSADEARDTITSAVISYLIPFGLEQAGIMPMTSSDVNAQTDPVQGEEFSFTVKVLPKPEYELNNYDPVEVSIPALTEVTEEDIDLQIQMLARQFATVKVDPETGEEEITVPEVSDEWVAANLKDMGVTSVEELRNQFRETSRRVKQDQFEQSKVTAIMQVWADRFDGEVSDKMIDAMTDDMFEAFKLELVQQGQTLIDFMLQHKTDENQIRASLAVQAKNQLVQGFILDAIFRHEDLGLEIADLTKMLSTMAPGREEDVLDQMQRSGRSFLIREGAARMKALEWAVDNAIITAL